MIVLVDASVWIDYFRNRHTAETDTLDELLAADAELATCGVILTEVLQGIRNETQYHRVSRLMGHLQFLPTTRDEYLAAAQLFRKAQKAGKTLRSTVDGIIAAVAVRHDALLLHTDRDFTHLAKISPLRCWQAA